jgi:hypothetical protein
MTISNKQRVTLFLNPSLLKHAKAQAIVEETSLTSLIDKALKKYLPRETVINNFEVNKEVLNRKTLQ